MPAVIAEGAFSAGSARQQTLQDIDAGYGTVQVASAWLLWRLTLTVSSCYLDGVHLSRPMQLNINVQKTTNYIIQVYQMEKGPPQANSQQYNGLLYFLSTAGCHTYSTEPLESILVWSCQLFLPYCWNKQKSLLEVRTKHTYKVIELLNLWNLPWYMWSITVEAYCFTNHLIAPMGLGLLQTDRKIGSPQIT